jgi:DNA end-binding protein Ku
MVARANWKGYLKLSLVSCAIALYPATSSSSKVRFSTLNRATGNKVKRLYVDPSTEEPVETEDQVKGYQVGKGSFVFVEDEDLDAIRIESTHTIDIEGFVPREQVDPRYFEAPYYLVPEDRVSQEAFAVIRDAMREEGRVGLARVVISRRERIILLEPLGKGIMGTVLRYGYEVRDEKSYFEEIPEMKLPPEMGNLARHIIGTMATDFDPAKFEDRYENAVIELLKSKQAGAAPAVPSAAPPPSNVINLMDALKRSIEAEGATSAKKAPSKTSAERAASAKGPKKAAPAKAPRIATKKAG